ncbi:L,D-transpeptidase [Streptomyces sp. NBC_01304]|uniref:L,D-transpeptidase n=1 Tax=Streptomyces sp. NBC_01304 TaxID=2903818 RepID=UPI002E0FE6A9|nr:L,D-transpeptidase [Streptomyces sp. NBC_01304]
MRNRSQSPHRLCAAALTVLLAASLTVGKAAADADPRPVPEHLLVPGIPLTPEAPYQQDTPDQGTTLPRQDGSRPTDPNPGAEYAAPSTPIEYVPPAEQQMPGARQRPYCSTSTGPRQRQVESYLGLKVDGRQSAADCRAVRNFQLSVGVRPSNGFAGPVTHQLLALRWARTHTDRLKGCPQRRGRVVCVDLSRQLLWVRQDDTMLFRPVLIRSGRAGLPTRTGWFKVGYRVKNEWSRLYNSPMPFSQYFSGGQALHGTYGNIFRPPGSHGCVNLRYVDAERLWKVLRRGDRIYAWGHRPGS